MCIPIKQYNNFIIQCCLIILMMSNSISTVQASDWIYQVRKGDNLWNFTANYLIDISYVKQLQKINNISDPWHIKPGTKLKIPKQWIKHYPALIRVQNLQGTAKIINEESGSPYPVKVGTIIMLGDTVSTNANSHLTLGFLDGTVILLLENSRLKIERLMLLENTGMSDVRLKLEEGRLETQVVPERGTAGHFQIKTPVTVTSVRGTDYRISTEKKANKSNTEVLNGKVAVKGVRKLSLLAAGFGNTTLKGQDPGGPIKLLAAPDISRLPRLFDKLPIQFSIAKTKNIQSYRVQISRTALFHDVFFDQQYFSDIIRAATLADGNYYLRIRAIDEQQLEGYSSAFPFSINALPEAPFLLTPRQGNGILIDDPVNFSWTGQEETNQYHLQVAKDAKFRDIIIDKLKINGTELSIATLQPIGKYFWRIAAIDMEGDGPFSEAQMFRRILPAPKIEEPEITDDSLIILAQKGLPRQSYQLQMADEDTFKQPIFDKRSNIPQFKIPNPDSGGEYFIRLRTIDPDGFIGPFSRPQSIHIPYNLYWLLAWLPLLALVAL